MILKNLLTDDTRISDEFIDGWEEITAQELQEILLTRKVVPDPNFEILNEIAALLNEAKLVPGQEWLLDVGMASMVSAGATMGLTEPQLYAANPGYKQVKDLAAKVAAKKALL